VKGGIAMDYRTKRESFQTMKQPKSGILHIDESWFFYRKQKGRQKNANNTLQAGISGKTAPTS